MVIEIQVGDYIKVNPQKNLYYSCWGKVERIENELYSVKTLEGLFQVASASRPRLILSLSLHADFIQRADLILTRLIGLKKLIEKYLPSEKVSLHILKLLIQKESPNLSEIESHLLDSLESKVNTHLAKINYIAPETTIKELQKIYDNLKIKGKLYATESEILLNNLASHSNCSPELAVKLFKIQPKAVLNSPVLDLFLLEDLTFTKQLCEINSTIFETTKLSLNLQRSVANLSDSKYRYYLAKNPNCHPEIFAKLSQDSDYNVRKKLALNINLPSNILEQLKRDENDSVQFCAKTFRAKAINWYFE